MLKGTFEILPAIDLRLSRSAVVLNQTENILYVAIYNFGDTPAESTKIRVYLTFSHILFIYCL